MSAHRTALLQAAFLLNEFRRDHVCGYRSGEHGTCDCKYPLNGRPWTSEMTGCPELRDVVRSLRVAAKKEASL